MTDASDEHWAAIQEQFLADRREEMFEEYGEEAIQSVMKMTALFASLISMGSDNIPLIKAGLARMAELVNEMLPRLHGEGTTRNYDERDLDGALGDIPPEVQRVFIRLVGDVLLHSKGGPHDSAVNISESVDRLALLVREEL